MHTLPLKQSHAADSTTTNKTEIHRDNHLLIHQSSKKMKMQAWEMASPVLLKYWSLALQLRKQNRGAIFLQSVADFPIPTPST